MKINVGKIEIIQIGKYEDRRLKVNTTCHVKQNLIYNKVNSVLKKSSYVTFLFFYVLVLFHLGYTLLLLFTQILDLILRKKNYNNYKYKRVASAHF